MFFSQLDMESEYTNGVVNTTWYYQLAFVGNFLLTLVSVYSFIQYRKKFPLPVNVCYILLILLIAAASFNDYQEFIKTPSLFYSPKGIGTWINFGLLYFAAEEYYFTKIINWFKLVCFATMIFNLLRVISLSGVSSRDDALYAIRDTTVFLLWTYPFFFLDESDNTNISKIVKYGMIALLGFFAFFISSRSYMLIVMFYILFKVKRDLSDKKNTFVFVPLLGIIFLAGYFAMVKLQDISSFKSALSIFSDRIGEDTRTSQLIEFSHQYDVNNLFTGLGPTARWTWSGHKQGYYEWLDNQYILVIWWFGIQTGVIYFFYLVYALFVKNRANVLFITNAKRIIFFWILACGGFAIYITISTKIFYYFITMLIGSITLNRKYIKMRVSGLEEY